MNRGAKRVGECNSLVDRAVDSFKEKLPFLLSMGTHYFATLVWTGSTLLLERAVSIFMKGVDLEVGLPRKFPQWMFSLAKTSSFSQLGL